MGFGFNNHLGSNFGFNSGGLSNYFGNQFSIAKSFYLDGVDEYFRTPKANLSAYLNGADKEWTYITTIKRVKISAVQEIFGDSESKLFLSFQTNNRIQLRLRNSVDGDTFCNTTATFPNTKDFYTIAFRFKGSNSLGNRVSIFVNGVEFAVTDAVASYHDNPTNYYMVGSRGGGTDFGNYYQSQFSLNDYLTDAEILNHYNNGKPKDANALFGARNYMFINPDNSDDTAQFTLTDAINSITWSSINMEDEDKTPLTPYRDKYQTIFDNYSTIAMWTFEDVSVNGSTTTLFDYAGNQDLPNPAVANQCTFSGSNGNLNNLPCGSYTTDDYNDKSVSNWLSGTSTGACHFAFRTGSLVSGNRTIFSSTDTTTNNYLFSVLVSGGKLKVIVRNGGGASDRYEILGSTTLTINTNYVVSVYQNGTDLQLLINGSVETFSVSIGTAQTYWIGDVTLRDNITIGAQLTATPNYFEGDIAFVQFTSDSDTTTVTNNHNNIKTIFGI